MSEETVTYVVQVREYIENDEADGPITRPVWSDLEPVVVPPRTKARTAIRKALSEAGIIPREGGLEVRVLPPETAEPITVFPPEDAPGPRQMRL